MDLEEAKRPVGVFDSGMGGLTVLRECVRIMGNEDYIFYGDSYNAPYGIRSTEQVYQLSERIVQRLLRDDVKAIVIACNTATSAAATRLRKKYPDLPIVGLEPALKPAVLHRKNSTVVVMATPLTLKEKKFRDLTARFSDQAKIVSLPAPDLVEFIERGETDTPELRKYLKSILKPYIGRTDSVVLGCTHFPFAGRVIQDIMGSDVYVVDGGAGAARELRRLLEAGHMRRTENRTGHITFLNSSPDPGEVELSRKLFALAQEEMK